MLYYKAPLNVHCRTVDTLHLLLDVLAADQQASGKLVTRPHAAQLLEDLQGELASGGDDEGAEAVKLVPALAVELLQQLWSCGVCA